MQSLLPFQYPNYEQPINFSIHKQLGFSKFPVYFLQILPLGPDYALKVFTDSERAYEAYQREKYILSSICHPNIIQCMPDLEYRNINSPKCHSLILEYAPYEDFFTLVQNKGLNNEKVARSYFQQLIEGLEYLHANGIAHLDLKLENLLLGKNFQLKIADFDEAQTIKDKELIGHGTSCYRSPEMLTRKLDDIFAADIFSAGVILFLFRSREFPFIERTKGGVTELLDYDLFQQNNQLFWKKKSNGKKEANFFSESFKELINGMLEADPYKRWTIQDIKCCKWYNESTPSDEKLILHMEKVWERISSKHLFKGLA